MGGVSDGEGGVKEIWNWQEVGRWFSMGADAPIPLVVINAAAPDGAPPRRIRWFFPDL